MGCDILCASFSFSVCSQQSTRTVKPFAAVLISVVVPTMSTNDCSIVPLNLQASNM